MSGPSEIQAPPWYYPKRVPQLHRRHIDDDGSPWSAKRMELATIIRNRPRSLILMHGDRGTGKTQMAADLCWYASSIGVKAWYTAAADLFRDIRDSFKDGGECESKCIARYAGYGLLVIDEVHERGQTEFEDRTLVEIIDKRYGRECHTILVTNETRERARETLGPSIWSRMGEIGGYVHCNWKNYRKDGR